MTLTRNLSLRIALILLLGFVLLQLALAAAMLMPSPGWPRWPLNLPQPPEAARLVEAIERAAPSDRQGLARAMSAGLYTLRIERGFPPRSGQEAGEIRSQFAESLSGRRVEANLGGGWLARALPRWIGPGRLAAPSRIAIALRTGGVLVIEGSPSPPMRHFLRQRAVAGALGGLALLFVIWLAVRSSTRPLVRLAEGVRRLDPAGPDLPVEGPRETRELAAAFNEMKARIGGLLAERTRILAAVAHDLRTYLTRLRLRAEYIEDGDQRARAIGDLAEMSDLLDDTLLFAGGAGGGTDARERVDLAAELEALAAIRREMREPVALAVDGPPGAFEISGSVLAVRRAFNNILDNGLRYGGGIEVRLAAEGGEAVVTFADSGPGVAPEILDRLGEPFHRAEPSRGRATGGAGLGLAIVKALVGGLGGRVSFANRAEGGFLVTLAFPRA